jgi:hypothetical protein
MSTKIVKIRTEQANFQSPRKTSGPIVSPVVPEYHKILSNQYFGNF